MPTDGQPCRQNGCTGTIEDGYCNVCGLAAERATGRTLGSTATGGVGTAATLSPVSSSASAGSAASGRTGSRRSGRNSTSHSSRRQLGAGLVLVPELPSTDPEKVLLADPKVPDNKRLCAHCGAGLKRERGFCGQCGRKYSFTPTLHPGDIVSGQYEVKGALAYGGLGWIYLGFDQLLSRYVVLKGLLNTEDEASAAVAVAERKFLAVVKHPNIVGIYNFVRYGNEGFIVMEYVGGQTLKQLRRERGPLPVGEAIAYIHRILGAFSYLHQMGLVYCDFKPDNVMLEGGDVKLIDMGGVRRLDDTQGDIYGTVGYSAPEAGEGPTPVSDLFTVGRTLAVLLTNIPGFAKEHEYTLPSQAEEPLFARHESLYRFLVRATAYKADERFQSADEMADQLLGVLREIVAVESNVPRPATSLLFGGDLLALSNPAELDRIAADHRFLPVPVLAADDPAIALVTNAVALSDAGKRAVALRQIVNSMPASAEARLRLASALIDGGDLQEAGILLDRTELEDPWDWRVRWYRGRLLLAGDKPAEALKTFDAVYSELPGEIAPKLAVGLAAERAAKLDWAIRMYDLVSRTDPAYLSAAFGLARCRSAKGDRSGAVEALQRAPSTSHFWTRAQIETALILVSTEKSLPDLDALQRASAAIEALHLDGAEKYRLSRLLLATALHLISTKAINPSTAVRLLGQAVNERQLREGLEQSLRGMARLVNGPDRIRLIDEANRVRPFTLF